MGDGVPQSGCAVESGRKGYAPDHAGRERGNSIRRGLFGTCFFEREPGTNLSVQKRRGFLRRRNDTMRNTGDFLRERMEEERK